jgi:copper oxidase (laccase) domain-containing protein
LAGGVVEAALSAVCEAAACKPGEVECWLGACIGPRQFEVGADVLQAFGIDPLDADPKRFAARDLSASTERKWLANLPQLARDRLRGAGARELSGGDWCTVEGGSRFFSFRRDGVTGRMAAAIWIRS